LLGLDGAEIIIPLRKVLVAVEVAVDIFMFDDSVGCGFFDDC
jgi:hypothetical protein